VADKQDTQTEQAQRIHRAVNEVLALAHNATFNVALSDFSDWLAALDWDEFYVSRREGDAGLFVFRNGMYRGQYVSVHAEGATAVEGRDVPEDTHLTLPAAEVANVRSAVAVS
jgi:hypothetical protein